MNLQQVPSTSTIFASLILLASVTTAQLLTNGNSQLPSCASSCALLEQAAQACGGTTTADQQIWSCFCQSGYLTSLYNSPNGICDQTCTSASDNKQVMTWYKSNCGTDDGASEHADTGATTVVITSTSTSAAPTVAVSTTAAALPSTTASGGTVEPDSQPSNGSGSWWSTHYKWVIMLIVIFVGLLLLALIAVLLKRRHDRKADQIREGFNAGITTRKAPSNNPPGGRDGADDTTYTSNNTSQMMMAGALETGIGRDTPVRTRDAFMPYGYGYTRSDSRLASRGDVNGRKSPMARGGTPINELEKETGIGAGNDATPDGAATRKQRRVLVRERSVQGPESPEVEKGLR